MPQQADRFEGDAWEEPIRKFLDKEDKVTVGQIARDALGMQTDRIGTADQRRILAVLEQLPDWRKLPRVGSARRWGRV
jgi:hypothetical protein